VPKSNLFKIGVATAAATVGAVLAFTSVFAHTSQTASGRSMVGTIVNAATGASFVAFNDPAPTTLSDEKDQDAIEAAELAARIAAEQAALAAKLAAERAEEAAEAAATTCVAADMTEDTAERAADQSEDTTESGATESATEDSAEMAARQATDKPEDASEVKCAGAESEHHSDGDSKESSTTTFSSEGDH
jgi:hypothetical protein